MAAMDAEQLVEFGHPPKSYFTQLNAPLHGERKDSLPIRNDSGHDRDVIPLLVWAKGRCSRLDLQELLLTVSWP